MSDNKKENDKSGLLAVLIAVPALAICCGGGGVLLASAAGLFGALGGWLTGLGGVATMIGAFGALLLVRTARRRRAAYANDPERETCRFSNAEATSRPSAKGQS